jgi:hypothetical protein
MATMAEKHKRFAVQIHPSGGGGAVLLRFDSQDEAREYALEIASQGPGVVALYDAHTRLSESFAWNLENAPTADDVKELNGEE